MHTVSAYCIASAITAYLKSRKRDIGFVLLIMVLAFFSFGANNLDYFRYDIAFNGGSAHFQYEYGYVWLLKLVKALGFGSYRYVMIADALFIIYVFCSWRKCVQNTTYALCLYVIFIFFFDMLHHRNAVLAFITSLAFLFLYKGKNVYVAMIPCIIGPLFQTLGLLTGIMAIYSIIQNEKNGIKISGFEALCYVVASTIAAFGKGIIVFLSSNYHYFTKTGMFFTGNLDWTSFIIWSGSSLTFLFVMYNYGIRHLMYDDNENWDIHTRRAVGAMWRFCLFSIPCTFMTLWMNEIVRIFRIFFLMMFFMFAMVSKNIKSKNNIIIFGTMAAVNLAFVVVWLNRGMNIDGFWG